MTIAMQDRYCWEAETCDGRIITQGDDLIGAVRFSLRPAHGIDLPQHDLIGIALTRRFCRGFVRVLGGGLKEYLHCICTPHFRFYVRSSDGASLITPADYELYL